MIYVYIPMYCSDEHNNCQQAAAFYYKSHYNIAICLYLVISFVCVDWYWWGGCWWVIRCCLPWWILFGIGGGIRAIEGGWIWGCSWWWWHAKTCVRDWYTWFYNCATVDNNQLPLNQYLFLNISLKLSIMRY